MNNPWSIDVDRSLSYTFVRPHPLPIVLLSISYRGSRTFASALAAKLSLSLSRSLYFCFLLRSIDRENDRAIATDLSRYVVLCR